MRGLWLEPTLRAVLLLGALGVLGLAVAAPARATITAPTVVAGPNNTIVAVDGSALAPDGTGGIVYTGVADGITHIYVVPVSNGVYGTPVQVDTADPYGASQPAIAAGDGGELLVVWVQPYGVNSKGITQYALESAAMQAGSNAFTAPIMVDANVGESYTGSIAGIDPSLAMGPQGNAYVTYRVVTDSCNDVQEENNPLNDECPTFVQTGSAADEVMDFRVAEWAQGPWSALGAVNENPDLADPAPTATNGPQIAVTSNPTYGNAVVVWQENDSSGYARIYARRIYGGSVGDAMQLSPSTLNGQPVDVNADAPAVSYNQDAEVAFRLAAGSPLGAAEQLMEISVPIAAGSTATASPVASGASVGAPSVASNFAGATRVADAVGTQALAEDSTANSPFLLGSLSSGPALTSSGVEGGGVSAWQASTPAGLPYVSVRQDYPGGADQTGQLAAPLPGAITGLSLGADAYGDALIAWMQGSPGDAELVAEDVSVPPEAVNITASSGWVRPAKAKVSWLPSYDVSAVSYDLYVDGQLRVADITGPSATAPVDGVTSGGQSSSPDEGNTISHTLASLGLSSGRHEVLVIASDGAGQQVASGSSTVALDTTAPLIAESLADRRHGIALTVSDPDSGVDASATRIAWGDGTHTDHRATTSHVYKRKGRYVITAIVQDKAGNRGTEHLRVTVR